MQAHNEIISIIHYTCKTLGVRHACNSLKVHKSEATAGAVAYVVLISTLNNILTG